MEALKELKVISFVEEDTTLFNEESAATESLPNEKAVLWAEASYFHCPTLHPHKTCPACLHGALAHGTDRYECNKVPQKY